MYVVLVKRSIFTLWTLIIYQQGFYDTTINLPHLRNNHLIIIKITTIIPLIVTIIKITNLIVINCVTIIRITNIIIIDVVTIILMITNIIHTLSPSAT